MDEHASEATAECRTIEGHDLIGFEKQVIEIRISKLTLKSTNYVSYNITTCRPYHSCIQQALCQL